MQCGIFFAIGFYFCVVTADGAKGSLCFAAAFFLCRFVSFPPPVSLRSISLHSIPFRSIPFHSFPLYSTPRHATLLHATPLRSTLFHFISFHFISLFPSPPLSSPFLFTLTHFTTPPIPFPFLLLGDDFLFFSIVLIFQCHFFASRADTINCCFARVEEKEMGGLIFLSD